MVVLDLDRVAERPALGLRWPRPCIIIGGAAAAASAALKGSRDITLVKLYIAAPPRLWSLPSCSYLYSKLSSTRMVASFYLRAFP